MELDEYYAVFTAQTAPFVTGVNAMIAAGEKMAASVVEETGLVLTATERMSLGMTLAAGEVAAATDRMALEGAIAYDRLAASSLAASTAMEAAAVRATAANEAVTASIVQGEAASVARMQKMAVLGALGFGLVAAGAVKMASDFESSTTRLVTSAGETQAGLKVVQQGILDMTGEVGNSASELAKAMYIIESGGQHGAEGLKVLRAAAEGAAAEGADLYEVADAITSILQDYHLKADQSAMVTSKMVAAVGAGKTTFQEFSKSLSAILPIASNAHISLDDISGALASMTVHGMSAQQASQNMADAVRHMVAPTQVQTKELAQLGISSGDLADMLSSKGLTGTMQHLSETIIQHMGPSGKVLLNSLNQSKDAAHDANLMIQAMPPSIQGLARGFQSGAITLGDWRKTLKGLPADQANLLQQFASLQNRASGFNDLLKSGSPAAQSYQDALRRVTGDATGLNVALMLTGENTEYVNNAVGKVKDATTEAGNHVKGWAEIQETFNNKMHKAKAAMGGLAIEVGEHLLPAVSTFFGWIATGAAWLTKHHGVALALAVALGILAVGFTVAAIAIWVMNSAFLANPITWIVILIVAAIVLLIVIIYELVKHWHSIWGAIKDGALAVWHFLVMCWEGIVAAFWWCVHGVRDAALWVWHLLVDTWHGIANAAKDLWHNGIVKPIKSAWDKAKEWCGDAVDWMTALPGRIGAALKALPGKLKEAAEEGAHRFFYAIGFGIGKAYVFFRDLPKNTWHFITSMWDGIVRIGKEKWHQTVATFVAMKDGAISTVKSWWHSSVQAVKDGWNGTIKWGKDSYHKVVDSVIDMKDDAIKAVKDWWHDTTTSVKNGWDATVKWCKEAPPKAIAEFERLRREAVEKIGQMVDQTVAWLRALPGRAWTEVKALPGKVKDAVSDAGSWLYSAGQNIVNGAINGFKDKAKAMLDTVKGWGHDIAKGFKDAVGVKSPSTVFAEAGRFIVAGLVQGIESTQSKAVDAVGAMAGAMAMAPTVAVQLGVNSAGNLGAAGGAGGWRPPAQARAADRNIRVEVPVMVDGREVYRAIVPHAQQHKDRNGTTQLG